MQMIRLLFLLLFTAVSLCSTPAFAAVKLKATLSDDSIALGGSIRMQIQVEGVSRQATLHLPKLKNLSLTAMGPPSYNSSTIISNGKIQKWEGLVYQVTIVGYKVGTFQVPPVEVHFENQIYKTEPFRVEVFAIPDSAKSNMELQVQVPKKEMYLGESNSATFSWFVTSDVGDYVLDFPLLGLDEFNATLAPAPGNQKKVQLQVSGYPVPFFMEEVIRKRESWTRFQAKFRFKATKAGEFEINPARVQAKLVTGYQTERDFFGRQVRRPKLSLESALGTGFTIQVLPLPLPQPESFSGVVGTSQITATLENTNIKLGDPVPLEILVQGSGELQKIDPKHIRFPPELDQYFELAQEMEAGKFENNSIRFIQVIRPLAIGKLTLPPIRFSYFNPVSRSYETAESLPIQVQVAEVERLRAGDILPKAEGQNAEAANQLSVAQEFGPFVSANSFRQQKQSVDWFYILLLSPVLILGQLLWKRFKANQPAQQHKRAAMQQKERLKEELKALTEETQTTIFLQKAAGILVELKGGALQESQGLKALAQRLQAARYSRAEVSIAEKNQIREEISDLLQEAFAVKAA